MGYGFAGSISPKAAKKANAKLAMLRKTRPQRSRMAAFESKDKDEGAGKRAEIPAREINHPTNQTKGRTGSVSKGGSIGKPESQLHGNDINARRAPAFPKGGDVSAANPKTGNTRMKGPIARSGGPYGGGGRDTQ